MQGFNMGRYVPPEVEGTVTSGNALHNKRHPMGSAAAQTVRFEMPFPVWCGTCPKPTIIGQGVRFNAAKRRVGSYHSTPIFSFTFRHADCGGELEVRTDPANTEYVVERGGRRREPGLHVQGEEEEDLVSAEALKRASLANLAERGLGASSSSGGGGGGGGSSSNREAEREAAFAQLERTIADRAALARALTRVEELAEASERSGWDAPYERNAALRRGFREGRRERERAARADAEVAGRLGLGDGVVLGPELEVDRTRAALVDFGHVAGGDGDGDGGGGGGGGADMALMKPLFAPAGAAGDAGASSSAGRLSVGAAAAAAGESRGRAKKLKSEAKKEKTREGLIQEIGRSARKTRDPFLEGWGRDSPKGPVALPGLKRKRKPDESESSGATPDPSPAPEKTPDPGPKNAEGPAAGLVSYDSDTD